MSKSIYDEVYEDVRRLMQDEFDDPSRHENPKLNKQERINICIGVKQALEQAQKQEKLLALYKEYFRLSYLPKSAFNFIYVFNRLLEIKNKIKELENNEN